jgi:polyhydroxybutyrate depolymerase
MKGLASRLLPMIAAALLASAGACAHAPARPAMAVPPSAQPGDVERTVAVDGLMRSFLVHLPAGPEGHGPVPAVFVFHGLGQTGDMARRYTGFDEIADKEGFVVVYPNGTGDDPSWNAGGCCGYAVINNVDEAKFVRQILSDLEAVASIDDDHIYATGFSNGAMLTYRLACEMSDTFAAIAPVAGVLFYYGTCQPEEPVSVIHVHGLSDTKIPYAGDGLAGFGQQLSPVIYGIETWVQLDGCAGPVQVEKVGELTHTTYSPCRAGTAVELYTIAGGGHDWPVIAENPAFPSAIIWDFFAAHPKP